MKPRSMASLGGSELLEPLRKPLPPLRLPWSLAAAAWLSGAVMVLILAAYVALMAASLWFTLDYLVAHGRLLLQGTFRGSAVGYLALGFGVLGVLLLLVKPMFHASPSSRDSALLQPGEQPLFFEYLRHLSDALGTPMPARVRCDLSTNASATVRRSLRRGFRAELELTLGLPLLAAMDVREVSSIMAHELGHFTRTRSGQVLALIHVANMWFARAVFERDRFDQWLDVCCAEGGILRLPALLARLFLRVGRGILWVFMALGRLGTSMVSRADEYNSDRYAVRLCGPEVHVSSLRKTSTLSVVLQIALAEAAQSWEDKRLPDNLPLFVAARAERLDRVQRSEFLTSLGKEQTSWFSTHPCLADRIQAARSLDATPAVRSTRPAADLIEDFPRLCRKATIAFYRDILEGEFDPKTLVPSESILKNHADLAESQKALARYYQGEVLGIRPIYPAPEAGCAAEDPGLVRKELVENRMEMLGIVQGLQELMCDYASVDAVLRELFLLRRLAEAGIGLPPRPDLGLHEANRATIQKREDVMRERAAEIVRAMSRHEGIVRSRMTHALQLARSSERGIDLASLDRLLLTAAALERTQSTVQSASWNLRLLLVVMQIDAGNGNAFGFAVDRTARSLRDNLVELQEKLKDVAYPFEHGKSGITLSGYLFDQLVIKSTPAAVAGIAMSVLQRVDLLIWRVLSQLAVTAEQVEADLGLAPAESPEMVASEEWAERRPPLRTHPALQAPVAAVVLALIAALGYGVIEAAPRFAVLPKHEQYRPVIVSARWTPPPREDVWHRGFQAYQPFHTPHPRPGLHQPAVPNSTHVDQWGRLVITDMWGRPRVQDPTGHLQPYEPPADPSGVRHDAFGRPYVSPWEGHHPGVPRMDPMVPDPLRRQRSSNPFRPWDPRPPSYGPTVPQPGGSGPSLSWP